MQIALAGDAVAVAMMNLPSSQNCHSCNITSLLVTVGSIEIHTSGIDNVTGEWRDPCTNLPMTVDIVHLPQIICGVSLQPDTITNIRLIVASANATITGVVGTRSLTVPSGKLEISISPFANVDAGKTTTVVAEFHVICTGTENGNGNSGCKLTPGLHAMPEGPD